MINRNEDLYLKSILSIKDSLEKLVDITEARLHVDVFTGDGTTKKFTLTKTLIGNAFNVNVISGGVEQVPDTDYKYYSSGNYILFNTAPSSGANVIIKYIIKDKGTGNFMVDVFTGNGTTNSFILTYTPRGDTENIGASVNKVELIPNTDYNYSETDNTITFTTTPGISQAIIIKYFTKE